MVKSDEGVAHRFPLEGDLLQDFFDKVFVVRLAALLQVFLRVVHLEAFLVAIELRIDRLGIMAEVEALHVVDDAAKPFAEVGEVYSAFSVTIFYF